MPSNRLKEKTEEKKEDDDALVELQDKSEKGERKKVMKLLNDPGQSDIETIKTMIRGKADANAKVCTVKRLCTSPSGKVALKLSKLC